MSLNDDFRFYVEYLRKQNKLTQEQFAEKMCVSISVYGKLARGKMDWNSTLIEKAANALNKQPKIILL